MPNNGYYLIDEEATAEALAAVNEDTHKIIMAAGHKYYPPVYEKEKDPETGKLVDTDVVKEPERYEYKREIKIIVELNESELGRVALKKEVKALKDTIDPFTQDVVVEDVDGVPTPKIKDLTKAEKDHLAANLHEPIEATQQEIDAMNELTHKVITVSAGFADGTIRAIKQIVEMSEAEKLQYEIDLLKAKVKDGTATADDIERLDLLLKII